MIAAGFGELKEAFLPYGYILSASLANSREIMSSAYDLVSLNRYLDLIYLLGYDYNGPWDRKVGASAPLKGLSKRDERNVEYTIKYLLSFGISPDKLVLAIRFIGRTFILIESDVKNIEFGKTEAKINGFSGPYLNGMNMYGYIEVCLDLKNNSKWVYHWDKESSTPYLRDGRRIVSYDDTRSIANKVKLAIEFNLAGFMAWSIDTDDFKGLCDMPNDTYTDFPVRFNDITKDKFWQDSSKSPSTQGPKHGKVVVCYLSSWAMFRKPPVKFEISDIDPTLCTHIVYAFAGLDEDSHTIKSLNQWLDVDQNNGNAGYKNLTGIKKTYPHIKVILSLAGWDEGSVKLSKMAGNRWERLRFIRSVMQYLEKYEFDGLDIMWKYPTMRGGSPEDRENFVYLIKELKEAFLPYGYILSASLSNTKEIMSSVFDLVNLNRYLDLIYLLGYDYNGPWDRRVGASAPLKELNKQDERNVEYNIKYLLSFGISPDKLVLAIQFIGRTFILKESDVKNIEFGKTEAEIIGFSGPYLNGMNMYGYIEVCLDLKNNFKWVYHWDKESSTPYLRDGGRIISYDDTRSVANKVKLAIEYNLAGFMAWSIDTDDFKGLCDMPNDTYTDFPVRFNDITKDKFWQDSSKSPSTQGDSEGNGCGYLRNKQILGLKQNNFRNYPLLRTINEAIYIALEEKNIVDAIDLARTSLKEQKFEQNIGDSSDTKSCEITCSEVCFYGPGD